MKKDGKKIAMLTCYDATFASLLESIGVHALLVGDSLGMIIKGDQNTHHVSLDDMIYHTKAVSRGASSSFIISDLPIDTYSTTEIAYKNALALIEAGADMVKLEGGKSLAPIVKYLKGKGIQVCGHIGYMPQSVQDASNKTIQDVLKKSFGTVLEDATTLEKSGVDMLVLSSIPENTAKEITEAVSVPTIGFHSGQVCNGEVFILHDLLINSNMSNDLYVSDVNSPHKNGIVKDFLLQFIKNHS
jgi:3-methyl-2-oxobutanoate hydroxymethyltransferase